MSATRPRTPAAVKKAAAARSEAMPAGKTFSWRGEQFTLPPTLPATVAFDAASLEDDPQITDLLRFLGGIIGSDQLAKVRARVAADGDSIDAFADIVTELADLILTPYGMSLGESEASPTSSPSDGTPSRPTSNGSTS